MSSNAIKPGSEGKPLVQRFVPKGPTVIDEQRSRMGSQGHPESAGRSPEWLQCHLHPCKGNLPNGPVWAEPDAVAQSQENQEDKSRGERLPRSAKLLQVQDEIESLCMTVQSSLKNCFSATDTKGIIEVKFETSETTFG